ncbi:amidase [Haladaptatus caseinilyticus]|uniref:amidase n=1 Tax=Haladaptatus caseinilyticus TaxID=2993314 RepID=UPI00224ABC15|nr:amidase [Haladaptatus caseinilyticus]
MSASQFELLEATIDDIHQAYEVSDLDSRELVDSYLERIEAYDGNGPKIRSIITVNPSARERAKTLDQEFQESGTFVGPLHGIPVVVKDQIETKGITTTFGSIAFENYVPDQNATIIDRLEDAGAIILAKTNLPDWATSWFAFSSVLGRTKNPYALDRDPGGSSSGTGAAVAANFASVGIGEDTGGSIRLPASFTNLFGLRVTPGLISRTGLSPLVISQDTAGPMTRTVKDTAILLDVLVGYDSTDPYTVTNELTHVDGTYVEQLSKDGLRDARIGILRDKFGNESDSESVNRLVEDTIELMSDAGADIVDPVRIADIDEYVEETSLYLVQSKRDINEFLSDRADTPVESVDEIYEQEKYHELLDLLEGIADGPMDPEDDPSYWRKIVLQDTFQRILLNVFAEHRLDAVLCPDVQVVPPKADEVRSGVLDTLTFPTNTVIASQAGCCAMSVPTGLTDEGLPVGAELIGKPYDEATVLNLAYAYEQIADPRVVPNTTPALKSEE